MSFYLKAYLEDNLYILHDIKNNIIYELNPILYYAIKNLRTNSLDINYYKNYNLETYYILNFLYNKNILNNIKEIREVKTRYLRTILWHLTEFCNLKCLHCYVEASPESSIGFSYSEAMKIVREFVNANIVSVNLTGGEVMTVKYLPDLIKNLYDNGIAVEGILTNGTVLQREILELSEKYNLSFFISIDGISAHKILRGIGIEKVIENIKELKNHNVRDTYKYCTL